MDILSTPMLRTLNMEGMLLATALKQVDLHKLIMGMEWDLDLLPTPLQVVMGSLGQLEKLDQGKH